MVLGYHDLDKRYECWETREIDEDYDEEGIKNIIECPAGKHLFVFTCIAESDRTNLCV